MELRILTQFSKDPLWMKIFNEGGDLHTILCTQTFDIPESHVQQSYPNNPTMSYRDVQKTLNFGLAYGMSEFKLSDTLSISVDEAKSIIEAFFNKVPKVKECLDRFAAFGVKKGYIITSPPYSRRRLFPDAEKALLSNDEYAMGSIMRASMNTPIQGTNADIIKLALVNAQRAINENQYPVNILLSVYDEIQTECREDFAEQWKEILQFIMEDSAKTIITEIPVVAECNIADYWDH